MTLEKSRRSALILSAITVLAFTITDALLTIVLPYLASGDIHSIVANPQSLLKPGSLLGLGFFILIIIGILIAIGTFWFYRFFGERYYGVRGAIRWSLFGILFALFLWIPVWLIGEKVIVLTRILQIAGLFGAFFLSRWLVPFRNH